MYYTQEQIDRANQADLVLFLQSQGEPLERAGQEYRWKRHDSLTVRGNKWYRHSQSKGGGPIDFVMEFFGKSFTEAVELLTGEKGAAPPPDRPSSAPLSDFRLPPRSPDNRTARNYLTAARRIDEDVTGFFFASGDIYEDAAHHNAVFVGRDEDGIPRYAHSKGTAGNFRLDVKGSDKAFTPQREAIGTCPRCGAAVYEGKKNFYCSDRACSFVMWKNDRFFEQRKKAFTKAIAAALLKDGKVKIKGMYSTKTGKTFDGVVLLADTGGKYVNFRVEQNRK